MGSHQLARPRNLVVAVALILIAVVVFVLWWFQPQKLFIDDHVNEAAPVAVGGAARVLAQGPFHSGEHHTTGTVRLLDLGHGRTVLRLEELRTSNGPVVHVWLSAADSHASNSDIDRATHVDLGGLKGNIGSQNYAVPSGVAAAGLRTVVIWCNRFHVSFGAAPLLAV